MRRREYLRWLRLPAVARRILAAGVIGSLLGGCALVSGRSDELRHPDDPAPPITVEDMARGHITARAMDEHVAFLGSDRARGRNGARSSATRVAAWVASQFQIAGLVPGGDDGGFVRYQVHVDERGDTTHVPSVIAVAPGSGGQLADQPIVVVARFGDGGPVDVPRSAVAALVEIARAVAALPEQVRRPILFVALSGSAGSVLDSDGFADHPEAGLNRAVAVLEIGGIGTAGAQSLLVDRYELSSIGPLLTHIAGSTPRLGLRVMAAELSTGQSATSAADRVGGSSRDIPVVGLSTAASEAPGDGRGSDPSADADVDVDVTARAARLIFLTVHHLAVERAPPETTRPRPPAVGGR
jgi:hypothetical protein